MDNINCLNETEKTDKYIFKCNVCELEDTNFKNFKKHMHETHKIYKCYFSTDKSTDKESFDKKKDLKSECKESFGNKEDLKNHILEIHKIYVCDSCDYMTDNKDKLSHLCNNKRTECSFKDCSYKTSIKCDLESHIRKHTGEKPYKCNECNYSSVQSSDLNKHIRIHTGENKFPCDTCTEKFCTVGQLKDHMKSKHKKDKFDCKFTGCTFKTAMYGQYRSHSATHSASHVPLKILLPEPISETVVIPLPEPISENNKKRPLEHEVSLPNKKKFRTTKNNKKRPLEHEEVSLPNKKKFRTTKNNRIYTKEEIQNLMKKEIETFKDYKLAISNYIKKKTGLEIIGLYTNKDINKGDIIGEYFGIVYDIDEKNIYEIYKRDFGVDDDNFMLRNTDTYDYFISDNLYLDASIDSHSSFTKFINSSYPDNCMTNCLFEINENKIFIKASRFIERNEELFLDYGTNTPLIVGDTNKYFNDVAVKKKDYSNIVRINDNNIEKIDNNDIFFNLEVYDIDNKKLSIKCKTNIDNFLKKYTFGFDISSNLKKKYEKICSTTEIKIYKFNDTQKIFTREEKFTIELNIKKNIIKKDGNKSKRKSKSKKIRNHSRRRN